ERLRLGHDDGDGLYASVRDRRWMGGAEEERPSSVDQEVPYSLRGGDVTAQHPHRLGKRPDLEVDASVEAEVVDRAASVRPQHAAGVRVVDHHQRLEPLSTLDDRRQWCDIAVHAEDTVR